ncbi:MAG: transporter substrate-binding domain-containing protein [Nitrospinae bacterium]|nr:transporter substrate-binding domain-containing protein [Nitrospinota bacterium]
MPLFIVLLLSIAVQGAAIARAEGSLLAQVNASGILRVCTDPDNLPFSSKDPREPGYDVELAGEVAKELGARAEITWMSTVLGRSAIRQLLEGKCDVFMGLPHDQRFLSDNPRLTLSSPYYTLHHVLVSPVAQPLKALSDLRSQKVAVEAMSLGDIFLFQNGQRREIYRTQSEAFQAVVRGEAQGAFLWAPIGRWLVKKHPDARLQAVDVSVPDLEFQLSIGMRKGEEDFQTAVNKVITQMVAQGKVADILARYGQPSPVMAQPAAAANEGRSLYYQICAPCHGQSAEGGGPVPNLKEFQGGEERFLKVALNGRPDGGMPAWKGKLSEDELRAILAFIQTLPK